jgi:putative ABC transport system substrate-binding protein
MTGGRGVLLVLGILLASAGPFVRAAEAQAPRPVKIGALTESWGPTPAIVGLRDGLQELGYRENKDFVLGVRFTQGNLAELPEAARALVQRGVDVIIASGPGAHAAKAAQAATKRIPIVFLGGSDPVEAGLVKSFARPGGNITGIADLEAELVPKRMEIFRELVPGLKGILFVYGATDPDAAARLQVHRDAANRLGLKLVERPARTEEEVRAAISGLRKGEIEGIFAPRSMPLNIQGLILDTATKRSIPTMFHDVIFVEQAGLASYSASLYEVGRQAARLVDKILKGAKPADLPVELPTKFELVVNLKAAKALGITIPRSILMRADRVIE